MLRDEMIDLLIDDDVRRFKSSSNPIDEYISLRIIGCGGYENWMDSTLMQEIYDRELLNGEENEIRN